MPDLLSEPELGFVRERLAELAQGIITAATAGDVDGCLHLAKAHAGYVSWLLGVVGERQIERAREARDEASAAV
jgi:hypothetical protein